MHGRWQRSATARSCAGDARAQHTGDGTRGQGARSVINATSGGLPNRMGRLL